MNFQVVKYSAKYFNHVEQEFVLKSPCLWLEKK